jgi:hypothetical protein
MFTGGCCPTVGAAMGIEEGDVRGFGETEGSIGEGDIEGFFGLTAYGSTAGPRTMGTEEGDIEGFFGFTAYGSTAGPRTMGTEEGDDEGRLGFTAYGSMVVNVGLLVGVCGRRVGMTA